MKEFNWTTKPLFLFLARSSEEDPIELMNSVRNFIDHIDMRTVPKKERSEIYSMAGYGKAKLKKVNKNGSFIVEFIN